ncbi:hemolysin family protein [Sedimentibacter sp. MB31-C6]|uniref:hemolysin family protein n=1 Tax=Sedimentibacter sp. MB31-C6 TaxID=3109366 RepID=UPI002DDD4144|nr:hemolysin family protein [Sedimentibacter sp. MB36-C1]WSI04535.1 hemolysin family protein [Sedimentibacter sp. MB36-C1]
MDSDGISQVSIFLLLLIMSGFFSGTENAYINYNRIRMKYLANSNNKKADLALKLDEDFDSLMATIFICNIIVNITITSLSLFIISKNFQNISITMATIITIIVIVIFGEMLPKGLANMAPEKTAMLSAPIIRILVILFKPLNIFFCSWKKICSKIVKEEEQPSITEDELKSMIDEVENEGVINKSESDLLRSAIEFNETIVEDIYTPRIDILGIEENDSLEHIKDIFLISGYSRLPVFQGDIDHIIGVLHEKDFYQSLNRKEKNIKKLISKVLFITPNKKISELLRDLQLSKAHMAIVIDEYGGTEGLVTMEDIIEELVGEIWDEHDKVIEWFKKVGDEKFLISCNADIDDMFDLFDIEQDEELDVTTVNGWLTMIFEEIPEEGDKISYKNLDITVTKAEAKKVLEIKVERVNRECDVI